ncbi:MAG: VOC family protein [Acidimicrobiales bacterium]
MDHQIHLDHIALAAEVAFDNFDRYAGDLGGRLVGGGFDPGFYWGQVVFEGGMKLEMLEPYNWHEFDFLRRFLDRNGPGPHHCTFKVPDIRAAVASVRAAGYQVVGERFEDPEWQEAFIHPKSSHGIVVQLAEVPVDSQSPEQADTPPARSGSQARLERIVHLVDDLSEPPKLFEDLLGGRRVDEGENSEGRFIDLQWPVDGNIRLLSPTAPEAVAWLGSRSGRNYRLEFSVTDPARVTGAREMSPGRFELKPEDNLGTRLHLLRR